MLIFTLLFLLTASVLYLLLRQRGAGWQCYFAMTVVTVVAWLCAVGAFATAMDNPETSTNGLSLVAMVVIAGFALYPFILWAAAKMFERGRST